MHNIFQNYICWFSKVFFLYLFMQAKQYSVIRGAKYYDFYVDITILRSTNENYDFLVTIRCVWLKIKIYVFSINNPPCLFGWNWNNWAFWRNKCPSSAIQLWIGIICSYLCIDKGQAKEWCFVFPPIRAPR